jgi:kynurenine formamidase
LNAGLTPVQRFWQNMECVDLSVPLSEEFPVNWPTLPSFRRSILNWFEDYRLPTGENVRSLGYYYDQSLQLDEHTGTHVDFPVHVLPPSKLVELERKYGSHAPLQNFAGPAAVVDATAFLDRAPAGKSPRIPPSVAETWEQQNGPIEPGDVVLLNTGYMDRYFAPFPQGRRLLHEPVLSNNVPGWPVPSNELFQFLGRRGVRHLGITSPSMGALDDSPGPHQAGIALGMTFAECLIGLDKLPPRGALYVGLPLKIAGQSGSPIRAVAFTPSRKSSGAPGK